MVKQPPHIQAILDRCTRDGVTSWPNVAKQMGRPEPSVRSELDPTYMREPEPVVAPPPPPPPKPPFLADLHVPKRAINRIIQETAAKHGCTVDNLLAKGGPRAVSTARHEAIQAIFDTGLYSLPQIAKFLGGRDHTTIHHSLYRSTRSRSRVREAAE